MYRSAACHLLCSENRKGRCFAPLPTHGVIPAEAGIHVRGASRISSAGIAFSMDSGLRRNDTVRV